jgi:hypothetical protein
MFTIEEWKIISDCLTYAESEGRWTEDEVNSILVKLPIDTPQWHQDNEYRIKPQPKQPKYLYAYYRDKVYFLQDKDASNRYYIGKLVVNDD